jgi:hypothetical protein
MEIPQPSYKANNSHREGEFLCTLCMSHYDVWVCIAHPNLCERRGFWILTGLLSIPPTIAGFSLLNRKEEESERCGNWKLFMQSESIEVDYCSRMSHTCELRMPVDLKWSHTRRRAESWWWARKSGKRSNRINFELGIFWETRVKATLLQRFRIEIM